MDREKKVILAGVYVWAGLLAGAYILIETGTGGRRYQRLADKDPTGVLESNFGRGVVQLGKAALGTVTWPVLWLSTLGSDSRRRV